MIKTDNRLGAAIQQLFFKLTTSKNKKTTVLFALLIVALKW
jgi:hypothetical protein